MVTIVIRKNLVKKAAGVSVACALTIGMNVVIAGPEESTLFQQMGLIKTAAGAEVTNATVAPAIAPTPISINNQKRVTLNQVVSDEFVGPMLPSATPTPTPTTTPAPTAKPTVKPVAKRYRSLVLSVAKDYVNVRKSRSTDSKVMGKLHRGSSAKILKVKGDWVKIRSGKVTGYVKKEYVATGARAEKLSTRFGKNYAVVKKGTDTLNVREKKNTKSDIVTQITDGDDAIVQSISKDWVKIKTDSGKVGYVAKEYVSTTLKFKHAVSAAQKKASESAKSTSTAKEPSGKSGSAVVKYALQFVGNPYVWGGTSLTGGADCSGFTMRIYEKFGYSLPHSSAAQAGYGRSVSMSSLQPGDLLFYKHGSSIGHVAMYIGGGRIVHAAGKKWGIVTANAFYRTPCCARRILG